VLLPLRQHLQRAPQAQDGVLGAVLFLCGVAAPEAAESPARHVVGLRVLDGEESHSDVLLVSLAYCLRGLWCRVGWLVCLLVCLSWSSDPPRAWWSESESYRRVGLFARMLLFLEDFEMVVLCGSQSIVVAWDGFGVLLL
jgi:hypothetical protein